jgi:hypothetical protein
VSSRDDHTLVISLTKKYCCRFLLASVYVGKRLIVAGRNAVRSNSAATGDIRGALPSPISFAKGENKMKTMFRAVAVSVFGTMLLPVLAQAQAPARPFHDGPVWQLTFIKAKPGVGLKYMNYLAADWKTEQEALKSSGLSLDYKVIQSESHGPNDWSLMLMTEFKDLATMEANKDKAREVVNKALHSDDTKMISGYEERESWREILGERTAREIVLEPKR